MALAQQQAGQQAPAFLLAPINYLGDLDNTPFTDGDGYQGNALEGNNTFNADAWDYWRFCARAGDTVTIETHRLTSDMDPAQQICEGTAADTTGISGFASCGPDMAYITTDDDNNGIPHGVGGAFADPRSFFVAPSTGEYTLAVWDFLGASSGLATVPYEIHLAGVVSCVLSKEITSGPDEDGDSNVDVVVPVKPGAALEYDFTISYDDPEGPPVLVVDTLPAEWIAVQLDGEDIDGGEGGPGIDSCGEFVSYNSTDGPVEIYKNGKKGKKCQSATQIEWVPSQNLAIDDGIMWTTHGDGTRLGVIDTADATELDVGAQGVNQSWAAAFDTNGDLYGTYNGFSGNAQLALFNQGTGAIASTIGGLGTSLIALEVDSSGQLWGVGYFDRILYRINKSNAVVTPIGSTGILNTMDLAFAPDGTLYSTTGNFLYELNPATGSVVNTIPINGILLGGVMGIAYDSSDRLFATAYINASPLYEIDLNSGNAVVVGPTTFNFPHGGDIFIDTSTPDLKVDADTRPSPGKGHKAPVFAPTSCGALYLNDGAIAFETDGDGNLVLDNEGNPVVVVGPTDALCLAAVSQDLYDALVDYGDTADHDNDGLSSHEEACNGVTDACNPDTDGDGVLDGADECPLEGPADPALGEILNPDGCLRQSQCSDGLDNEPDGNIDFPDDASCDDILDDSEDTVDPSGPEVCDTGTDGVISGDPWVVCRVGATDAWISADNSGTYDATAACQALGYSGFVENGGTCGNVCGYCEAATSCSSPGNEVYDGSNSAVFPTLAFTVNWRCE